MVWEWHNVSHWRLSWVGHVERSRWALTGSVSFPCVVHRYAFCPCQCVGAGFIGTHHSLLAVFEGSGKHLSTLLSAALQLCIIFLCILHKDVLSCFCKSADFLMVQCDVALLFRTTSKIYNLAEAKRLWLNIADFGRTWSIKFALVMYLSAASLTLELLGK